MNHSEFAAGLKSTDDRRRADTINAASALGAPCVPTAAQLLADSDTETRRAAKRALDYVVHHAGRPGAAKEARAVETELLASLAAATAAQQKRELIWLVSEIGDADSVKALADLMANADVREDARCALERIPGRASLRALRRALRTVPEDFRPAVADSLRHRGDKVPEYPSRRLVPTKTTTVKASS
jgi:hypothetical protein